MTVFKIGDRVRIKWSLGWPELAGQTGTIVDKSGGGMFGTSEWRVSPDCWGSHFSPRPGLFGGTHFCPQSSQLEPLILGDAHEAAEDEFADHMRRLADGVPA